jgi:hypothetical protein
MRWRCQLSLSKIWYVLLLTDTALDRKQKNLLRDDMTEHDPYDHGLSLLRDQLFYLLSELELAFERGFAQLSQQDAAIFRARLDLMSARARERS